MKKIALSMICLAVAIFFLGLTAGKAGAMEFIYKDVQYSFQALRIISETPGGGADIGECLMTFSRIPEGDDEAWYREWFKTAGRREKTGEAFLAAGNRVSARKEFLRACNYYRTAEFFLHENPNDPRILSTYTKSRESFLKFARLSDRPIRPVEIPFEKTTLPGYFCLADSSGMKRPLLLIHTGFDGTAEEIYIEQVQAALERGLNCLVFEGPGQGRVIRKQGLPFRPDWESVVTPVVDFAVKQPEVNSKKIALMGISFGGYLAPRAAAFEHRLSALIANGGVYDFHAGVMKGIEEKDLDDPQAAAAIDRETEKTMKTNPSLRWAVGNGLFTFGAKSPADWLKMTRPYNLRDVAEKIKCPTLIVDSEADKDLPGQAQKLYDALKCPRDFLLFTAQDGAEEHCQMGAMVFANERILDWLDGVMKKIK